MRMDDTGKLCKRCGLILLILQSLSAKAMQYAALSLEELGELDVYNSTVLEAHIHKKRDVMFAYHYERSHMSGMGSGDSKLSSTDVLQDFMVTPLEMDMEMHMLHAMYAPSDDLTLMLMLQYMNMDMIHKTRMGQQFITHSEGVTDTEVSANYIFTQGQQSDGSYRWYSHAALILPTGDIDSKDDTPMGHVVLPYAMQLGAGSYQARVGLGLDHVLTTSSYGLLLTLQTPLDKNDQGYRPAERVSWQSWYQKSLHDQVSVDLGLNYLWANSISGEDQRLNPAMVPTADSDNYGGQSLNVSVGVSYLLKRDYRLTVHADTPLWQGVNGPQLRKQWSFSLSLEVLL